MNNSSAPGGWGPLLYDIALEYAGKKGVLPDRGQVSADALRVWTYYLRNRSDVEKYSMDDDTGHPLGLRYFPEDCGTYDDWDGPKEALDFRYIKLRPTVIPELKRRGLWVEGDAPQTPGWGADDETWEDYQRQMRRVARRYASVKFVQTVPVRLTVDVRQVTPRRPSLEEEPIVQVRGVIDLSPDPTEHELPVWFDAEIHVFKDATAEILTFEPTYGVLHGIQGGNLLGMYEHAFSLALVNTHLRIIGVRR
jgi:hypothetical protein